MEGAKDAIDIIIQMMRTPLVGGWLSVMHIIMGVVLLDVGIILWRYFAEKLGY